ncbi:hypothetical protein GCM10010363_73400 [Streptomyces omiyaensis]|nr:hypothetical protein GCM10010363_73400 [Streptomyces omiyaensis]
MLRPTATRPVAGVGHETGDAFQAGVGAGVFRRAGGTKSLPSTDSAPGTPAGPGGAVRAAHVGAESRETLSPAATIPTTPDLTRLPARFPEFPEE